MSDLPEQPVPSDAGTSSTAPGTGDLAASAAPTTPPEASSQLSADPQGMSASAMPDPTMPDPTGAPTPVASPEQSGAAQSEAGALAESPATDAAKARAGEPSAAASHPQPTLESPPTRVDGEGDGEGTADGPTAADPAPAGHGAASAGDNAEPGTAAQTPQETASGAPAAKKVVGPPYPEVAALMKQHFPALFDGPPKPLKLRIQADIQERAPGIFSRRTLGVFFHRYTGSTAYLKGLVHQEQRFDLDGQPAGELTEEHRQIARDELKRRRDLVRERERQKPRLRGADGAPSGAADGTALGSQARVAPADGGAADGQARPPRGPRRPAEGPGERLGPRGPGDGRPAPGRGDQGGRGPAGPRAERSDRRPRQARADDQRPVSRAADARGEPSGRGGQERGAPGHGGHEGRGGPGADWPRERARHAGAELPPMTAEQAQADQARRERANLLREFERSPFTLDNFCKLKGLQPADTAPVLEQARRELAERRKGQ